MPIYRFETSNAYTELEADEYTLDRHNVATFTRNDQTVAVLREWQTIALKDAIHTGDKQPTPTRPASGLPL